MREPTLTKDQRIDGNRETGVEWANLQLAISEYALKMNLLGRRDPSNILTWATKRLLEERDGTKSKPSKSNWAHRREARIKEAQRTKIHPNYGRAGVRHP